MNADILISEKKELRKLQKLLGIELAKGKYKDTQKILQYKSDIKNKKIKIGNITKDMISQL